MKINFSFVFAGDQVLEISYFNVGLSEEDQDEAGKKKVDVILSVGAGVIGKEAGSGGGMVKLAAARKPVGQQEGESVLPAGAVVSGEGRTATGDGNVDSYSCNFCGKKYKLPVPYERHLATHAQKEADTSQEGHRVEDKVLSDGSVKLETDDERCNLLASSEQSWLISMSQAFLV